MPLGRNKVEGRIRPEGLVFASCALVCEGECWTMDEGWPKSSNTATSKIWEAKKYNERGKAETQQSRTPQPGGQNDTAFLQSNNI